MIFGDQRRSSIANGGRFMTTALMPLPAAPKRSTWREPAALETREVDRLVSKLLAEIKIPFDSLGTRVLNQLSELKKILSTDYVEAPGLPSTSMLKELAQIVETHITGRTNAYGGLADLGSPRLLGYMSQLFGPREIALRAEPYVSGAGLALRGFFCRTTFGDKSKFVIFVNTAHHPGAVAATLGHEIGHYIYGSLIGEKADYTAFMEGTIANHLLEEDELFADSLVALGAYSRELIKKIGDVSLLKPGFSDNLFSQIKSAYELIGPRFDLDLVRGKMAAAWRVRYLTSMAHFFKLRCALYKSAGI